MDPFRVLVVDDSAFMRKIITDVIEQDSQFVVVGTAINGIEAVASVETLKPDVVTLDLEMPLMNGIDALQHILKKQKLPVIMLSGISEANTRDTIKALQFGAFDFIRKPTSVGAKAQDISAVGEMLVEKLKIAVLTRRKTVATPIIKDSEKNDKKITQKLPDIKPNIIKNDKINNKQNTSLQSNKKTSILDNKIDSAVKRSAIEETKSAVKQPSTIAKEAAKNEGQNFSSQTPQARHQITQIVAIGTSTGGPRALHEVITALPGNLKAPILIVQHMPPRFTHSLAQRLDSFSAVSVVEAEHGMLLENGKAYVAPGGFHMELVFQNHRYKIQLTSEPARNGHRPSVDALYDSLIPFNELERHIVLMTGMGSDGAQGMKKLYENGVKSTIAEAEESCIVYGMPRSAVELGVASKVLPLTQIASEIINVVMR